MCLASPLPCLGDSRDPPDHGKLTNPLLIERKIPETHGGIRFGGGAEAFFWQVIKSGTPAEKRISTQTDGPQRIPPVVVAAC